MKRRVRRLACKAELFVAALPKILSAVFGASRVLKFAAPVVRKIPLADRPDMEWSDISRETDGRDAANQAIQFGR